MKKHDYWLGGENNTLQYDLNPNPNLELLWVILTILLPYIHTTKEQVAHVAGRMSFVGMKLPKQLSHVCMAYSLNEK